jgi:hypothetical protein
VLPIVGPVTIGVPLHDLTKSVPPTPEDWFAWTTLIFRVAAVVYAVAFVSRDPGVGERVGSIVADE